MGHHIVPFEQLPRRVVSISRGQKTLARALSIGDGQSEGFRMPLAVIVDDRRDVRIMPNLLQNSLSP